jgi:ATP-dependent RNA helicase SUPV3L1/SUV3
VGFPVQAGQPRGFAAAIGFEPLGSACLRIDIVERLAARLRALARQGPFVLEPDLMAMTGLGREPLEGVVLALGFARDGDSFVRRKTKPAATPQRRADGHSPFAGLREMLVNQ